MFRFTCGGLLAFSVLANTSLAEPQAWPLRPVKVLVPFAAGGNIDVMGRLASARLSEALAQQFVIENRVGGNGIIATEAVARARPDGYTLLLAPSSFAVNVSLYERAPYDPFKDFEPVAEVSAFPVMFTVRTDLGVNSLRDLIALAKEKARRLNYSTPGPGTSPHLATELLKQRAGIDMVHIPYPGAAQAAQALLNGTVELGTMSIAAALPQIEAGRFKGLAVTGAERWGDLPQVPTVPEAGIPEFVSETWQGMLAPAGTPREATDKLAQALTMIVQNPDVRERLRHAGFAATGRGPDAFARRIAEDVPKWKAVIEKARIGVQ
jgi:tripartite-type tricarboxylate transporter receptor subunit TctC